MNKKYTLEQAISLEMPETTRLNLLDYIYPDKCAGPGVALFSAFNVFAAVYKDKTGIDLGAPIDSSKKLLSEDDIRDLNFRIREMKGSLKNLCKCMMENEK